MGVGSYVQRGSGRGCRGIESGMRRRALCSGVCMGNCGTSRDVWVWNFLLNLVTSTCSALGCSGGSGEVLRVLVGSGGSRECDKRLRHLKDEHYARCKAWRVHKVGHIPYDGIGRVARSRAPRDSTNCKSADLPCEKTEEEQQASRWLRRLLLLPTCMDARPGPLLQVVAKRPVTEHPHRGVDTFLGDPCYAGFTPLEKEGVG